MIVCPLGVVRTIADAAEAAYPDEACGLLIGRRTKRTTYLEAAVHSPNRATSRRRDRFEVDPKLHFDLMRSLEGTPRRIVGHYHSHPDQPSEPSPTDVAMAFDPDLVWLIVSVVDGQAVHLGAFRPTADQRCFNRLALRTTP